MIIGTYMHVSYSALAMAAILIKKVIPSFREVFFLLDIEPNLLVLFENVKGVLVFNTVYIC